ncbi:MAG: extracellular solute-binding protein [Deltaproteobacteria bacterium]|nr:extracellular solute-binding protein [Deltaproteobacteria bacterium]
MTVDDSRAASATFDPYSSQEIAKKDYSGITLEVLSLEKPVLGEPVELHARQFEALTGIKININFVAFDKLYQELLLGLKKNKYDALFYGSMWIADVVDSLEPIPEKMLVSPQFQDVMPHYKWIASWGDIPYQVPIDGDRHFLQYRKDILNDPIFKTEYQKETGRPLKVPETWIDLQQTARYFHEHPLDNGRTIAGLTEVSVSDALLGNQFIKRAAPYAMHPNVGGGFYFDLETMEPLINSPGFVEALKDFVAAQSLYPEGGRNFSFPQVIKSFGRGEAVFSDSWDDPFVEAMQPGNPLRNQVAAAMSPGSRRVWNRHSGAWEDFPQVNRAPYFVYGWTSAVAKSSKYKEAAFDFLGFYANRENHRSDMIIGRFGMNPFRNSDLDQEFWIKNAGWTKDVAESYVSTLTQMNQISNQVMDLRIYRGQEYVYLLSVGVYRAITGRDSPQKALDAVAERWKKLTERIGVDKQREAYRKVVQFEDLDKLK